MTDPPSITNDPLLVENDATIELVAANEARENWEEASEVVSEG